MLVSQDKIRRRRLQSMPHVIVTGGPGAGKTALLAELAARGYATVEESARAIIRERLARGASRRPDALAFAQEILRRDIEKYLRQPRTSKWVFFDRGLIDALGMLHEASPLPLIELETMLASYQFHATVFVLPPWKAIYANDAERASRLLRPLRSTPGSYGGAIRAAMFSMKYPAVLLHSEASMSSAFSQRAPRNPSQPPMR